MLTIITIDGKVYYGRYFAANAIGTTIAPIFRWENNRWRKSDATVRIGDRHDGGTYPTPVDIFDPNGDGQPF